MDKKCCFIYGHNFFFWNFRRKARHFSLRSKNSEYPRGANQNARKLLSTDLVNTKKTYFYLRKTNAKVDFYCNGCKAFWFVFIYSSRIISTLNVSTLLLPIFIQRSRGLHLIIMKTPLKWFYYTETSYSPFSFLCGQTGYVSGQTLSLGWHDICTLPLTLEIEFYSGDLTLISQALFLLTLSQNEIYNDENIESKN